MNSLYVFIGPNCMQYHSTKYNNLIRVFRDVKVCASHTPHLYLKDLFLRPATSDSLLSPFNAKGKGGGELSRVCDCEPQPNNG